MKNNKKDLDKKNITSESLLEIITNIFTGIVVIAVLLTLFVGLIKLCIFIWTA